MIWGKGPPPTRSKDNPQSGKKKSPKVTQARLNSLKPGGKTQHFNAMTASTASGPMPLPVLQQLLELAFGLTDPYSHYFVLRTHGFGIVYVAGNIVYHDIREVECCAEHALFLTSTLPRGDSTQTKSPSSIRLAAASSGCIIK